MAEEQLPNLNNLIDGLRARLHEELDLQLRGVGESHARALEQARQAADAEAEDRCTARLEVVRGEWNVRLEAAVANARSEAERAAEMQTVRVRMEMEQAAAESVAAARREIEQAFAAERQQFRSELEAERRRVTELEAASHRVPELEKEVQRIVSERDAHVQRVSYLEAEGQRQAGELEAERHRASELQADRQRVLDLDAARERTVTEIEALRQRSVAELDALRERVAQVEAEAARTTADLASERDRLKAQLESERQGAEADLQAARDYAAAELNAERERAAGSLSDATAVFEGARAASDAALVAPAPPPPIGAQAAPASVLAQAAAAADSSRVVEAIRTLDDARSLTELLASAVRAAAAEAQRAAMFLVQGPELREWPVPGVPSVDSSPLRVDGREAGIIADALKHHRPATTAGADHPSAPFFASLPPDGVAVAVPLLIGGTPVAVLYADHRGDDAAASGWQERVQILGRHAAACAASLTAIRTAQAMHLIGGGTHDHEPGDHADQVQAARRYARLLVSEIKLYNESAVRMGRERRDLLVRLEPEIGRARRLFDQRVAASVEGRDTLFEQELAQTLADGDPSLLGEPGHQSSSWT